MRSGIAVNMPNRSSTPDSEKQVAPLIPDTFGRTMKLKEYFDLTHQESSESPSMEEAGIPAWARDEVLRTEGRYGPEAWKPENVFEAGRDQQMEALCFLYATLPGPGQIALRAAVSQATGLDLLCYALRSASFALRAENPEAARLRIWNGVLAIALSNLAARDPRDDITLLHTLYHAGKQAGVESLAVFRTALPPCGPGVRSIFEDTSYPNPSGTSA